MVRRATFFNELNLRNPPCRFPTTTFYSQQNLTLSKELLLPVLRGF